MTTDITPTLGCLSVTKFFLVVTGVLLADAFAVVSQAMYTRLLKRSRKATSTIGRLRPRNPILAVAGRGRRASRISVRPGSVDSDLGILAALSSSESIFRLLLKVAVIGVQICNFQIF